MRKLKLLFNLDEWENWKNNNFIDDDVCSCPSEFPCYGYADVKNWNLQLEEAHYLYGEDLDVMIRDMYNP